MFHPSCYGRLASRSRDRNNRLVPSSTERLFKLLKKYRRLIGHFFAQFKHVLNKFIPN